MAAPNPFERLKNSRVVQILIVYLGASWVVLEVAGELQDALELPTWVAPVAFVLLLVGLVVVLATAWVQSNPQVDAREAAGEVPDEWEVGLGDLLATLRRGRLPHLTWGRALLGGLFAFWLLFGFAGLYVILGDREGPMASAPLVVEGVGAGLAVVPWSVNGLDPDVYGEGMITLLGTTLDGVAGLRAVDGRTVLARWDETVGDAERPDLAEVLDVARQAGARFALVGTAVRAGPDASLVAEIYDVETGVKLGTARAQGSPDSLMALVDGLAVETTRVLLAGRGEGVAPQHLESLTTPSMDALLAYLEGERHYRRGTWAAAVEAFQRATRLDSTFALAHLRAYQALGWSEASTREETRAEHLAAATRFQQRLTARERALLHVSQGASNADVEAIEAAEEAVRRYPDDPDLWFALGDLYVHVGQKALHPIQREREALERAAELLPDFVPYLIHLTEYELSFGDSASAAELLRRERALVDDTAVAFVRGHGAAFTAIHRDSATRPGLSDALDDGGWGFFMAATRGADRLQAREAVLGGLVREDPRYLPHRTNYATVLVSRGRVEDALKILPDSVWLGDRLRTVLGHYGLIPPDSLEELVWELNPGTFGAVYTAAVRGDTAAVRAAWAAFEESDLFENDFLRNLARGIWLRRTDGAAAAESTLVAAYEANNLGDELIGPYLQWLLGDLYEELGEDRRAFEYFRAAATDQPLAALRAARLADRLGLNEEARRLYRYVLSAWKDADPSFRPWVQEARRWSEPVAG